MRNIGNCDGAMVRSEGFSPPWGRGLGLREVAMNAGRSLAALPWTGRNAYWACAVLVLLSPLALSAVKLHIPI